MSERPELFTPPDEDQRRNYIFAMFIEYAHLLPSDVVDAVLGLDLIQFNQDGKRIVSMYEHNLQMGNVDKTIEEKGPKKFKLY